MRYLFLILLVSIISCNASSESKAKKLIKEDLAKKLQDFDSYEPINFSAVERDSIPSTQDPPADSIQLLIDQKKLDQWDREHTFMEKVWRMDHSFRTKNGFGAYRLLEYQYFFDSSISRILYHRDITKPG